MQISIQIALGQRPPQSDEPSGQNERDVSDPTSTQPATASTTSQRVLPDAHSVAPLVTLPQVLRMEQRCVSVFCVGEFSFITNVGPTYLDSNSAFSNAKISGPTAPTQLSAFRLWAEEILRDDEKMKKYAIRRFTRVVSRQLADSLVEEATNGGRRVKKQMHIIRPLTTATGMQVRYHQLPRTTTPPTQPPLRKTARRKSPPITP